MAILKKNTDRRMTIDLTGPDGNAFALLGYATSFMKQLSYSDERRKQVLADIKSGDYENLIKVFDREFGSFVDLER